MRRAEPAAPPARQGSGGSLVVGLVVLASAVWLARRPVLGWSVFGGLGLLGLALLVRRSAVGRPDPDRESPRRLPSLRWVLTGAGAVVLLGVVWRAPHAAVTGLGIGAVVLALILSGWFALRHGQPTPSVKREPDQQWRSRVQAEWPVTARAAGLAHPDVPGLVAPLAGPVAAHGPGGLTLRLDLDAALLAPEDVHAVASTLRRRMRADHVRVQPDGIDTAVVRAYRRHPLDIRVSWSDLRPVDDPAGEWVPVGLDEAARMAVLRWRLSTIGFGLQDAGKTMLVVRSMLRGLVVQGIPFRLWLWDNRADFRPLTRITHRYAADNLAGLSLLRELADRMDERMASAALDTADVHHPTRTDPADILVIGELLSAQRFRLPSGTPDAAGLRAEVGGLLQRIPAEGRPVSVSMWTTAQTPLKDVIGPLRDLFPQRVAARLWDASLVDPALGDGALERGGEAHLIPASLPGVAFIVDARTGWPVMVRGADIRPADTVRALVEPYEALMGPALRVIEGELA